MKDGIVRNSELDSIERDEEWLMQQIELQGIASVDDIFLAEFWRGEVSFILRDGKINRKNSHELKIIA
ncbi:hypothetical protein JY98_16530 [Exiguobacterium mexicanum]|nr:hypothetical protein JY98_16530 [Exiguobacterium mexicanum]